MDIISLVFYFIIVVPSSVFHEYAHGFVAERLGDPTARYAGRLTLDPRSHIDLWGTILLPLFLFLTSSALGYPFLFAYAKPVPYNPYNLRNQRWDPVLVALAGPFTNFLLALAFALIIKIIPSLDSRFILEIIWINI